MDTGELERTVDRDVLVAQERNHVSAAIKNARVGHHTKRTRPFSQLGSFLRGGVIGA